MAPSAFHPFPRLPLELRLDIWELAIRPTDGKHGLHHFIITRPEDDSPESFQLSHPHFWQPQHVATVPAENNKSVYLWDAGLWTACVESRDVIMKHFKVHQWDARRYHGGTGSDIAPFCVHHELSRGGDVSYPAETTAWRGQESWQLMVRPMVDMFCFKSKDWEFARGWMELSDFFADIPFTSHLSGHIPVRNIAFEFDPSWNIDFPRYISDLVEESSARGFIADTMFALPRDQPLDPRYLKVWLIDHDARWCSERGRDSSPAFYDCEQTFVQVRPGQVEFPGYEKTAAHFIDLLSDIGDDAFAGASRDPSWIPSEGWTKGHIRMLARPENQIDKDNGYWSWG